jgi:DNA-binding GntR family transcriptional regulator
MASVLEEKVRGDVVSGELKPGSRLNLKELAQRYDAGVIPLREALSRLSTAGFITAEDQRGFRVAEISIEEVKDIHKQRFELESLALKASIQQGDLAWEAGVIAAHYTLSQVQTKLEGQPLAINPEWERAHSQFHLQLVSACNSPWLLRFIRILMEHSARYRQVGSYALVDGTATRNIASEHQAIMDATLARDADLACALLKSHYRSTADLVVDIISQMSGSSVNS